MRTVKYTKSVWWVMQNKAQTKKNRNKVIYTAQRAFKVAQGLLCTSSGRYDQSDAITVSTERGDRTARNMRRTAVAHRNDMDGKSAVSGIGN